VIVEDLTGPQQPRYANMPLEDLLDAMARVSASPSLSMSNLDNAASPHIKAIGGRIWKMDARLDIREGGDLYPYTLGERTFRYPNYVTFTGHGRTHHQAAANCMARIDLYLETGWNEMWSGHQDAERIKRENNIP
jgi:hypothetical protein